MGYGMAGLLVNDEEEGVGKKIINISVRRVCFSSEFQNGALLNKAVEHG
jgi:hypothetical protein